MDPQKAEAFAGRLLTALNGALCLMASIGHRTGLFDAMRDRAPQTSNEIASRAGLNERYVREWLGAMVTSGVVIVDPQSVRYHLPPEHAAFLTRAAAANNFAAFTQYVPLLGRVEDAIVECFKNGGGVPYEQFPRFHAVMAEDSGQSVVSSLESHILPLVPGLPISSRAACDLADDAGPRRAAARVGLVAISLPHVTRAGRRGVLACVAALHPIPRRGSRREPRLSACLRAVKRARPAGALRDMGLLIHSRRNTITGDRASSHSLTTAAMSVDQRRFGVLRRICRARTSDSVVALVGPTAPADRR
jgi:hypothetical protein